MRFAALCVVVIAVLAMTSCKFFQQTEEERYVGKVFAALAEKDWSDYEHLTTNRYKLLAREQAPNAFAAQGSFSGSVLAPEEAERIKEDFQRAVEVAENQIDFGSENYKGLKFVEEMRNDPLTEFGQGSTVPKLYSIITDKTKEGADPRQPYVVLAKKGGFVHFLGLVFSEDAEEEEEEQGEENSEE